MTTLEKLSDETLMLMNVNLDWGVGSIAHRRTQISTDYLVVLFLTAKHAKCVCVGWLLLWERLPRS